MEVRLVSMSSPIQSAVGARLFAAFAAFGRRGSRFGGLGRGFVAVAGALEQRIFFQLGVDVSRKVKAGELQQLDGLHQLRRHHQRLGLAELESL